ncbi:type II asparaginase [Emticicia sp. CRIBPO]|uniref:type II asparaginase n=1 Tax=Emticicia sp. CRIBPO TaxID=2683258 RepID=UPI0014126888|nr:type II asparaginase [Emticicia sp. CRIBPO]NBA87715.1 type II asparaginase [Emticicia sp. CRIBPO]
MKKLLLILIFSSYAISAASQNLPRIIVLSTGGTIAGQQPNTDRAGYIPGKIPVDELLKNIPSIKQKANIQGEQIAAIGSYDMTVEIWLKLARRINEIFAKNEADGVVITHGTDTQEETAYFLSLTVQSDKPVVLTGSMRPGTAISSDGPKNLYDAIIVASDVNSTGKGVLVCFNENVYEARHVVKVNTLNVNAFAAPNAGPIGQVYDGKVSYNAPSSVKNRSFVPFDISKTETLPTVEIVYAYADASNVAINAFINADHPGIIIAGTGNGSINKTILESVKTAVKKDIIVVRSSRVVSGQVTTQYVGPFEDAKLGTIVSNKLNPQKARILLMLALTVTKDKSKIQEMFLTY